jgi:hypothetical protein
MFSRWIAVPAVAGLIGFGGLGSAPDHGPAGHPQVVSRSTYSLALGESVVLGGHAVRATFESVSDDSRCKPGMTCVWEGDATVHLTLTTRHVAVPITLHTSTMFTTSADALGLRVSLVALNVAGDRIVIRVERLR